MPTISPWKELLHPVDILAIGAHPDDIELCCAGTLFKHQDLGYRIGLCDLTKGQLGTRGDEYRRMHEAEVARRLFHPDTVRINLGMDDGFFEETQENLLSVIQAIRYFRPRIILTNAVSDRHPDHGRASGLVTRAAFLSGLPKIITEYSGGSVEAHRPQHVFYYLQDRYHHPDFVVDITDHYELKMKSVLAYETQFYHEKMEGPDTPISGQSFLAFIESRAREMGRLINATYGEGFLSERPIGVENMMSLV